MEQEKTTEQIKFQYETLKIQAQELFLKWLLHTITEIDDIYAVRSLSEVMYDYHLRMIDLIEAQALQEA